MSHVFKHPKYYEELRRRGRGERAQATSSKLQAASSKLQAPSLESSELQASSPKHKVQASSRKLQAPRSLNQGTGKYFSQQV
jgi:hypothetical protein